MLDLLRELLKNPDPYIDDTVLEHFLNKAKKSIQSYLNYTDEEFAEIESKFQTQIIDLAIFYYKNRNNAGVIQQSQGSRSQSFEKGIPQEIKDSLPLPKVRVIG